MDESTLHRWLTWGVFGAAVPAFLYLILRPAPYGRHVREGFGPTIPPRVGWILMESPAVVFFAGCYAKGSHAAEVVPLVFLGTWQLHYIHRTFVFPFRMRAGGKRMTVLVAAAGALFNAVNSYVNARWISHFGTYEIDWLVSPFFIGGVALFFAGMATNLHADTVLLKLRAPGETGYKIPVGGLYRLVTCPNYLGEMVEWLGFAVATKSLAGLSFFVFTVANLLPRALTNQRWYREHFPDYPPKRRAVIPWLL